YATLQADGWTGVNFHHLVAFMIVANLKLYTVKVYDTTTERKTAANFLILLTETYKYVESNWHVKIAAVITDASGETQKAQKDFLAIFPSIVVLDCYAHQATNLITWLRSKTLILGLIQKTQEENNKSATGVIQPVLTRWTSHLRVFQCLLDLRGVLQHILSADCIQPREQQLIYNISDERGKHKLTEMDKLVMNENFWTRLAQVVQHLKPLSVAANLTQGAVCRLDTVLLTFGYLFYSYHTLMSSSDQLDQAGCSAILASIETQWKKADQEVFICAVLLNPLYNFSPFTTVDILINANIIALFSRLYERFYSASVPDDFSTDIYAYLNQINRFAPLTQTIEAARRLASLEGRDPDPISILSQFSFPGKPDSPFLDFARRIFSISANSASCERLFSLFGNILTKLRNCLGTQQVAELAEINMHIRDEHIQRAEVIKQRVRKLFMEQSASENDGNQIQRNTPPFRSLIQASIDRVLDDVDNDDLPLNPSLSSNTTSSAATQTSSAPIKIKIADLFDFHNTEWLSMLIKRSEQVLHQEDEICEVLNGGTSGDNSRVIDTDTTMEDIMFSA
ncbi:hypothetical protein AN958_06241, partial [Leucoagaricus sp. SymC.cos]